MTKKRRVPKKKGVVKKWGNSLVFINLKHWTCAYCGRPIKDNTPFSITLINGNPIPFILCSALCLKIHVMKLEAQRQ